MNYHCYIIAHTCIIKDIFYLSKKTEWIHFNITYYYMRIIINVYGKKRYHYCIIDTNLYTLFKKKNSHMYNVNRNYIKVFLTLWQTSLDVSPDIWPAYRKCMFKNVVTVIFLTFYKCHQNIQRICILYRISSFTTPEFNGQQNHSLKLINYSNINKILYH